MTEFLGKSVHFDVVSNGNHSKVSKFLDRKLFDKQCVPKGGVKGYNSNMFMFTDSVIFKLLIMS